MTADAAQAARQWVRQFVIGDNMCPFAAAVEHSGRVRYIVHESDGAIAPLTFALNEAIQLLTTPSSEVATTLIIYPSGLGELGTFLDLATELEGALSAAGADGVLQVATFHPDYVFAGSQPSDPANLTNRSPLPTLHLLREQDVSAAVDSHPDPAQIPRRNAEFLRRKHGTRSE